MQYRKMNREEPVSYTHLDVYKRQGLTGCEIAYDLILKGKKPTVIEMKNDRIAVKGVCLANSSFLREMLKYKKAPVYLNTKVKEILKDGVIAVSYTHLQKLIHP